MKKKGRKLEKRVEEEQRKLSKIREKKEKSAQQKKKKGKIQQRDITDKLKAKKPRKEQFQKSIDYQRFLEQQQHKLDYSAMFSYLGGSVKKQEYSYQPEDTKAAEALNRKYETITWEDVKVVTDEDKMNSVMGLQRDFEQNSRREAYKWWKAFNKGLGEYLFEVSMT